MKIAVQIIGILAMAANVLSYQFKKPRNVMLCQLIGSILFAVNMFSLGAMMGGLLNVIAVFRAAAYIQAERRNWNTKGLNWLFMALYGVSYVLVFTVFGKEPSALHLVVELLPVIGMVAMTVGFSKGTSKAIRICGFINSPCWLIYNSVNFSIGGILCEAVNLFSILSAFFRLDTPKKETRK